MTEAKRIEQLCREHAEWCERNFENRDPFAGMIEELGEFTHAYLKKSQGIRVGEKHDENLIDACCDMAIFMADYCSTRELNFVRVLELSHTINESSAGWSNQISCAGYGAFSEACLFSNGFGSFVESRNLYALVLRCLGKVSEGEQAGNLTVSQEIHQLALILWGIRKWFAHTPYRFEEKLIETWENVLSRDWKSDPVKGGSGGVEPETVPGPPDPPRPSSRRDFA